MFEQLLSTNAADWTGTILRIVVGLIIFPHGAQKLLGWFGGHGYRGTMGFFTQTVGLPKLVGLAVILVEFFGSIFLVAGIGTRVMALGILGLMTGIILTAHVPNGFFMNWSGTQKGEGYEYHLLVIGISAALLLSGGGAYSLDALLAN